MNTRRAPRGYTFAPCEGCGESANGRRIGSVCASCREKLDKFAQAEAERAERGDSSVYVVPSRPYWLPYLPHEPRVRRDGNDVQTIRAPLLRLTELVSHPTEAYPPEGTAHYGHLWPQDKSHDWKVRRAMPTAVADTLRELFTAIRDGLQAAHADGHAKGRALLLSLAAGTITNDQFNDAAARREGKD